MLLLFLLSVTVAFQVVSSQRMFLLVTTPMSWATANDYCKSHYEGLADILSLEDLNAVVLTATQTAWIGLHYNTVIRGLSWSNGAIYESPSWMPNVGTFLFGSGICGTMLSLVILPSSCNKQLPFICSYYLSGTDTPSIANTGSTATTQLLPFSGTASAPAGSSSDADFGYMVLKMDFVSAALVDLEAMKQQLLNEVEELLMGSFSKGTFQLQWVSYEQ
ncbi:putative C-type lectin domain-containing protein LINC00083 [Alligator mississippiensis]|uniref:C-type lectin domain-containing protein LINC00083 n=1 Tax=Alligator mississippiensis TaxID=8496 RepID=A0A151MID8_ALLMI|nr:putative C-type lectin domain-containing protein LINC00083 [Alligator mississippiensis]